MSNRDESSFNSIFKSAAPPVNARVEDETKQAAKENKMKPKSS